MGTSYLGLNSAANLGPLALGERNQSAVIGIVVQAAERDPVAGFVDSALGWPLVECVRLLARGKLIKFRRRCAIGSDQALRRYVLDHLQLILTTAGQRSDEHPWSIGCERQYVRGQPVDLQFANLAPSQLVRLFFREEHW